MSHTLAYERLRRLLFLVPWIAKNQGRPVDEVARVVGCSRADLLEELDLLTMIGRPPFQPDDYVDVYVEDDRVFLELDQRLSAPPRLTASEGVALAAAAALLKPEPGGALRAALDKLEAVLPEAALAAYREMARQLDVSGNLPDSLAPLTLAIVQHRELDLEYVNVDKGTRQQRRVRPLELLFHRGHWYLQAFCLTANAARLFRVDRIARSTLRDEHFTPPPGAAPALPGGNAERVVTVRFAPSVAPWQRERFGDAAQPGPDGSCVVTVPGDSERWLVRWILSFGGAATVLEPEWAIRAVADAASASLRST